MKNESIFQVNFIDNKVKKYVDTHSLKQSKKMKHMLNRYLTVLLWTLAILLNIYAIFLYDSKYAIETIILLSSTALEIAVAFLNCSITFSFSKFIFKNKILKHDFK